MWVMIPSVLTMCNKDTALRIRKRAREESLSRSKESASLNWETNQSVP